jgi:glycosyltransferase involved in cell wall biosynthesis
VTLLGDALKILQVIPYFYPAWRYGGSVRVAYDLCRKLVENGHSVTVYTSDTGNENALGDCVAKRVEGVNVFYFKNLNSFAAERKLFLTPSLLSAVRNDVKSFDIVHIHGIRTSQNPILHYFLKKNSVPYVVQAHGAIPRVGMAKMKLVYDLLFGCRLLKDASKVIALAPVEAQQYERMGVLEEKIAIIPNGIDLSEYAKLPPKGCFKKKFNIPEDKKVILYFGRIHKNKGIDFLVRAYNYLIKNMKLEHTLMVIAGPDDGYLSRTRSLVSSFELSDKVVFTGILQGKKKIEAYVDSNVVVNVEPRNVFGLVPLEAAACSTPVIVCRGNAISEVIHKGKFGFSVEYDDIVELAESMHRMLDIDTMSKEMGREGRKFIFENYGWTDIVPRLERVYEEALCYSSQICE